MVATGRSTALRRAGSFLALLAFEAGAVALLTRLGNVPSLRIPWHNLTPWIVDSPVEDVLAAILRTIALLVAWWLLASNVLYLLARLTHVPGAIRAVRWMTLPVLRRATDHALALTLATSLMGAGAGTGTALAASTPVVATAPQRSGPLAAETWQRPGTGGLLGYAPTPAGTGAPTEELPARDGTAPGYLPRTAGGILAQQPAPNPGEPGYVPRPAGNPGVPPPESTTTSSSTTSTTSQQPTTTSQRPTTTSEPPSTTSQRPTTTSQRPTTSEPPASTRATTTTTEAATTTSGPQSTSPPTTSPPANAPTTNAPPRAGGTTPPQAGGTTPPRTPAAPPTTSSATTTTIYIPRPAGLPTTTTTGPRSTTTTPTPPSTTGPPSSGGQAPAPAPQPTPPGEGQPARSHRVVEGDNLWTIARDHIAAMTNRSSSQLSDHEIATYWLRVIAVNRSSLRSGNPDLIFPGELIMLPPVNTSA
jgi:hypothetical protein